MSGLPERSDCLEPSKVESLRVLEWHGTGAKNGLLRRLHAKWFRSLRAKIVGDLHAKRRGWLRIVRYYS
jgi:hypothetical protein